MDEAVFVDRAEIFVRAGRGGNGCVSFRREKYVPRGGPDGGDGGRGGDVYLLADPSITTLLDLAGHHHWIAENGRPGQGKNRTGRTGDDCIVRLPPGTEVYDRDLGILIKDLDIPEMKVRIARGGEGGRGNQNFATSVKQTPRLATPGGEPEERWLRLELKLIADVGLVGLPNAGKSTLLSRTSRARPKIADYPFTTIEPQLGIVELSGFRRFVMADIPGLIEGAHEGVGLGDDFLRHIERTRVIVHLIDLHPLEGQPTPSDAYAIIRNELSKYSQTLADKPELVVANKIDLSPTTEAADYLSQALGREVLAISGVTGAGIPELCERLWELVAHAREQEPISTDRGKRERLGDPFADSSETTDLTDNDAS